MRFSLFACLVAFVMVGACTRYGATPFDMSASDTVAKASYKAADVLAGQAYNTLTTSTPLAIGTVSDVNRIESSSALGRMISEQIGARFVQLGYNISEPKLRADMNVQQPDDGGIGAGEYVISRRGDALAAHTNARVVMSGTYAAGGDHVLVNLRLIDVMNAHVLAAHDYALPMNADIRRMVQTDGGRGGIFSLRGAD